MYFQINFFQNEKLAAFLAQNKTIPDGSSEEELGGKLALFDAVSGSGGRYSKEQLDDTARSMGASEMVINIDGVLDLYSIVNFPVIFSLRMVKGTFSVEHNIGG